MHRIESGWANGHYGQEIDAMSKETTKSYSFLGKYKSEKRNYVALEPFEVKLTHDFAKVKTTPDGLLAQLEKIAKKASEDCENKCHKGIVELEGKIKKILEHALLASQMSKSKGPINKAAKEAEALIKRVNSVIEKEAGAVPGAVQEGAKKALGKKFAEAFKAYKVTGKAPDSAALTFLFVAPKIKESDDKLPAAQGLRKGALSIGKLIVSESKIEATLSTELNKSIDAYTSALWQDKDFGKAGGLNRDRELWKTHGNAGKAAADKLQKYSDFINNILDSVEGRQTIVDTRTKKLKKEISSMEDKANAKKAEPLFSDVTATNKKMWLALKELSGFAETKKAYIKLMEPLLTEKHVSESKGSFEKKWKDARGSKSMDSPKKHILSTAKHLKGVSDTLEKVMA
jgi:hypothetical protein